VSAVLDLKLADVQERRKVVRRIRGESRRWILRGTLFVVMAVVSFSRPGSFWLVLGVMFGILAVLSWHLSRQSARSADELERKIAMIEGAERGTGGTGGTGGDRLDRRA
jgi:hypothetical protein